VMPVAIDHVGLERPAPQRFGGAATYHTATEAREQRRAAWPGRDRLR
jgi:hypothetical protein